MERQWVYYNVILTTDDNNGEGKRRRRRGEVLMAWLMVCIYDNF